jgi:hypothetical protein
MNQGEPSLGVMLSHGQRIMIGIVPAAFLALVTAGSVSVYGDSDPILFIMAIVLFCILSLASVMFVLKKTPT